MIHINKFGSVLTSRQAGKEAYSAFLPSLNELSADGKIIADFEGVSTFTPSWGDEFLTPILKRFGARLELINTNNPSVRLTVETLETVHNIKFTIA